MGKLLDRLTKQLETEYKQDAQYCIKIYNSLMNIVTNTWELEYETEWCALVTIIKFSPVIYKPTNIGYTYLKGINENTNLISFYNWMQQYQDLSSAMRINEVDSENELIEIWKQI